MSATKLGVAPEKGLNIFQKIHAVQEQISTIAKNGRNTFQNYDYLTEADVVSSLRPLLIKQGIVIIPNVAPNIAVEDLGKGKLTSTIMAYKVVNMDDPTDFVQVSVPAQGSDNGDKGAYKLITGAKKFMLQNLFMIVSGNDPEKTETSGKKVVKSNQKEFF